MQKKRNFNSGSLIVVALAFFIFSIPRANASSQNTYHDTFNDFSFQYPADWSQGSTFTPFQSPDGRYELTIGKFPPMQFLSNGASDAARAYVRVLKEKKGVVLNSSGDTTIGGRSALKIHYTDELGISHIAVITKDIWNFLVISLSTNRESADSDDLLDKIANSTQLSSFSHIISHTGLSSGAENVLDGEYGVSVFLPKEFTLIDNYIYSGSGNALHIGQNWLRIELFGSSITHAGMLVFRTRKTSSKDYSLCNLLVEISSSPCTQSDISNIRGWKVMKFNGIVSMMPAEIPFLDKGQYSMEAGGMDIGKWKYVTVILWPEEKNNSRINRQIWQNLKLSPYLKND